MLALLRGGAGATGGCAALERAGRAYFGALARAAESGALRAALAAEPLAWAEWLDATLQLRAACDPWTAE